MKGLQCNVPSMFLKRGFSVSLGPGTPRSEVQEEVECAPSPHLALTLKVR